MATPKPLKRSSQKLEGVITSWISPGMQNFVSIRLGVSAPQIRGVTIFYVRFFWFFNKATAYIRERIFTQNTSIDVVPGKEVPFGVPMTTNYIYTLVAEIRGLKNSFHQVTPIFCLLTSSVALLPVPVFFRFLRTLTKITSPPWIWLVN